MEEPAVGFFRCRDFHDRAVIPVCLCEVAGFLNAAFNSVEDASIPFAIAAVASDAVASVPAAPIDLPGHARVAAYVVDFEVVFARHGGRFGIVRFAIDERTGGENRSECNGGVAYDFGFRISDFGFG